jgi:hypothetical protein
VSFWSTAIARFYPARASFHRQLRRLMSDPRRTWVGSPIPERTLLLLQQLPSLLADRRTRRALLRYFVTDVGVGLVNRALYHGLRLLPFDTSSAIGGGLGLIVGRWRGISQSDACARETLVRLRPESTAKVNVDVAMNRMYINIGRVFAEYTILDLLMGGGPDYSIGG